MVHLDLGNLLIHLRADTTQYDRAMLAVAQRMQAMSVKLVALGRALMFRISLPLTIIGALSTIAFARFDDAMTKSLAIMGDVTDSMKKKMTDLALTISKEGVTSAKDLAKSYFFLASAGLTAEQSLAALGTVERFAVAGAFDMAKATDLLTDAQSALGLRMDDANKNMENMRRLSNLLTGANTLANASTEQFSEALTTQAGAAMKAYNIPLEEGLALLAAYADQGIKAQRAGTMLSRMLRLSTKGILNNQKAWTKLGVAFFDIQGNVLPMAKIITLLSERLGAMTTKQKIASLALLGFQARSQQAILPLLGLGDRIAEYTRKLKAMGEVTDEVADVQLQSFSSQMKTTWNQIVGMSISIGRLLAPAILRMGARIRQVTKWWKGLTDQTKKWVVIISAGLAAAGPIILGLGLLIGALGKILKLFTIVALVTNKWIIAAMAVAAVAYVVRAAWLQSGDSIKAALAGMRDWFITIYEDIDASTQGFLSDFVGYFLQAFRDIGKNAKTLWRSLFAGVEATWKAIWEGTGKGARPRKDIWAERYLEALEEFDRVMTDVSFESGAAFERIWKGTKSELVIVNDKVKFLLKKLMDDVIIQLGEDGQRLRAKMSEILESMFPKKEQFSAEALRYGQDLMEMYEMILAGPAKQLSVAERRIEAFKNKIIRNMQAMRDAAAGTFAGNLFSGDISVESAVARYQRALTRIAQIEQNHFRRLEQMRKRLGVDQEKGPIADFGSNAAEVADLMQGGKFKKFEVVRTSLVDPRSQDTSLVNINKRIMDINTRILSESEKQTEGIRELVDSQTE